MDERKVKVMQYAKKYGSIQKGIAALTRSVRGVEVGVLITEIEKGKVKISLRSDKIIDVSQIADKFGGGGHIRAAGITVFESSAGEMRKKLELELEKALNEH